MLLNKDSLNIDNAKCVKIPKTDFVKHKALLHSDFNK